MRSLKLVVASVLLVGIAHAGSTVRPSLVPTDFTDALWVGSIPNPTAHCWTPDGRMLVCEKGNSSSKVARVRVIKSGTLLGTAFHSFTVNTDGERGLLGIAVDPSFASNHFVYVYYSNTSPMENRVSRLVADGDVSTGAETIIKHVPIGNVYHNGGAIHFGPDGKLYVGAGDSHSGGADSQNPNVMGGKILRINSDGTIPSDNPTSFQGGLTVTGGPKEGWCCGLRNPYTFAFQPGTGLMYINDVGQDTNEEIDDGVKGKNYGWQGGATDGIRNNPNFTDPIHQYPHSGSSKAITGGVFYNPSTVMFPASYVGKYFFADYAVNRIWYLTPGTPASGGSLTSTLFTTTLLGGPVDLTIGPDGALYYSAQNSNAIGRISYSAPASQDILLSTSTLTFNEGTSGTFTVQLAAQPASDVTVNLARSAGNTNITVSPASMTFTSSTWSTPKTATVSSVAVADGTNQTATITASSTGLTSKTVSVTATDVGGSGIPSVTIAKPDNGSVVSGSSADYYGTATISGGFTLDKADFYVDGVLASTNLANSSGHFHYNGSHLSWDTTKLSDGVHVLTMVVTASNGATGSDTNLCVVANGTAYEQVAGGDNLVVIEGDRYHQQVGGKEAAAGHAWTPTTAFGGQSGSYALEAAPNDNLATINTGYAATSPRLDYLVHFATTGTYYVWVRGWGPDGSSDSCHVGLDGQEIATSDRITGFAANWTWSNQTMDGPVASVEVPVAGVHAVSVWMREDGFVFDKLLLTTNASLAPPVGTGPAVSAGAPPVASTGGGTTGGGGGGGGCGLIGLEALLLLAAARRRRR